MDSRLFRPFPTALGQDLKAGPSSPWRISRRPAPQIADSLAPHLLLIKTRKARGINASIIESAT
eukprot:8616782-Pyramimonas_sp.AAC.1